MASSDSARPARHPRWLASVLICAGVLMIGASLLLPEQSLARSGWSDEQAVQYQAAAANLHRLSHEAAEASPGEQAEAIRRELDEAQAKYNHLRTELDAARGLTGRVTKTLRLLGVALALVGVVLTLTSRQG